MLIKQLLSIQILLFGFSGAYAQIQDGYFTQWDTAYHWMYQANGIYEIVPAVWSSNNEPRPDWSLQHFSTPATRSEDSPIDDYSLMLQSSALGIDASYSGILYQDISMKNLSEISFLSKCDSLSGNSGCFVDIFGFYQNDNLHLIYQDSIKEEEEFFNNHVISIEDFVTNEYDSLRLQFRAKGAGGFEDSDILGHTVFLIDGVQSSYITKSTDLENGLSVYPNPTDGNLVIDAMAQVVQMIYVRDINGNLITSSECYETKCELNLDKAPSGLYFVLIKMTNGVTQVNKIIKSSS